MPFRISLFAALACFAALPLLVTGCEHPKSAEPLAPPALEVAAAAPSELPQSSSNSPGQDAAPATAVDEKNRETAILAGGCFWGMEEILRDVEGVIDTEVGYAGGAVASPTYQDVKKGTSGHAESVRVVFDRTKLSYEELLEKWFFRMHDPTTEDRQGNDVGSQYRSAIFFTSVAQEKAARAVIEKVERSGQWDKPIVTEVVKATGFTAAESIHQDYLEKNPGGYTCHYLRDPVY